MGEWEDWMEALLWEGRCGDCAYLLVRENKYGMTLECNTQRAEPFSFFLFLVEGGG